MKLRNKKTGEIKEVIVSGFPVSGKTELWECSEMDSNEESGYKCLGTYNSIAELNEEWEDYEEPKEYWFIRDHNPIVGYAPVNNSEAAKYRKEIGNYFETKEEAKKAVEKLKAWKRLKNIGFRFSDFSYTELCDYARINIKATMINDNINDDLDLLFGGEE